MNTIIENNSSLSLEEAFLLCAKVVSHGKTCNESTQYCYSVRFPVEGGRYVSVINKVCDGADKLILVDS